MNWLHNRFLAGGAIASAIYWLLAAYVPGPHMIAVANSIFVGVAIAVIITWGPSAWRAFRDGGREGWQQLVAAPVITLGAFVCLRIYVAVVRAFDMPDELVNSPVIGYMLLMSGCGCMLYLSSPGTANGVTPPRNWLWIVGAVAIGMLVAGIGIGTVVGGGPGQEARDTRAIILSDGVVGCPPHAPVKGNHGRTGRFFHAPGGDNYRSTVPELCFPDEWHARNRGYRAPGEPKIPDPPSRG